MNYLIKAEARLNGLSSGGKKETGCKQRRVWVWKRTFFFFRVERLELGYILTWLSWGQGNVVEKGRSLRR